MRAAVRYEGAAREAILALKFRGQRRVAEPPSELLADLCAQEQIPVDVIVPVPLHAARQRQRGYNQAELLARQSSSRLARPMNPDLLTRVRDTPPQTTLPATERRCNVMDAFALAQSAHAEIGGKHVLLVDDVATTGSTLDAAAAALTQAHPASIWVLSSPARMSARVKWQLYDALSCGRQFARLDQWLAWLSRSDQAPFGYHSIYGIALQR